MNKNIIKEQTMKLKVLVDNNTYIDQYYYGEPAVSYYIEDEDTKFIFDVGYSDLFIKNAKLFNINLKKIDSIVFSHGHNDHTGGLEYFLKRDNIENIRIVAHPDAFNKKFVDGLSIGSPVSKEEVEAKCKLHLSSSPFKISKNIIFLGEIPYYEKFGSKKSIGTEIINGISSDDYVNDDSALVYQTRNGIYIITGCSHSGICNIIEYAKKVSNDNRVLGVIGGLHLFEVNNEVKTVISYLNNNNIKELYPCHCTSFEVKAEIYKSIPIKEVGVGLEINW
jgi:7,8-dihydropterin-6-yl-methyl-4-(beta-D-ribofuranosyl)aminobenzene 5'-phosphate synthase